MTGLDYEGSARDLFFELANQGALAGVRRQYVPELLQEYQAFLEDAVQRTIYNELRRLGRLRQFQQVWRETPDRVTTYLQQAIAGYIATLLLSLALPRLTLA
jgi:hypothetical protein